MNHLTEHPPWKVGEKCVKAFGWNRQEKVVTIVRLTPTGRAVTSDGTTFKPINRRGEAVEWGAQRSTYTARLKRTDPEVLAQVAAKAHRDNLIGRLAVSLSDRYGRGAEEWAKVSDELLETLAKAVLTDTP